MDEFESTIAADEALAGPAGHGEEGEASSFARADLDEELASDPPSSEPDGNDDDDEDEADEDRFEEIERNGRKATIPAWLKPELMMQADYTRKTQELADARRAFESERKEVQQLTQAELSAHANLNSIDLQIEQFSKVDWSAWQGNDPVAAQNAFARFQLLQNARRETLGYLGSLQEERGSRAQQESEARFQECAAELARDLNDWSPELSAKLRDFGQRHYGFSIEELDGIDDARAIKALHAAYQWEQHRAGQRRAEQHAVAQAVRPAVKVGGAAPKSGLDDRLSAEEWLRRRNAQVRKRA